MDVQILNHESVLSCLPQRDPWAHKGDYGKILLLCGSRGYTGAAALAAMGALRVGAGLVYLGVPDCIYKIEATKLLEPVIIPLPDKDGMLSVEALPIIEQKLSHLDAVLIGPGLGVSDDTQKIVIWILQNFHGPVIVDADGINVLSGHIDVLRERAYPTVLTPHEGEFKRLTGMDCEIRVPSAIQAAKDTSSIMVLKGHDTVITDGQTIYINPTGNPGMAVGGSGDVLAGIITGLVGQGIEPLKAAAAGAWIHGAAGDLCAKELGQYSMLPSDMLGVISRLLK